MKTMKRIAALVLALVMVLAMGIVAFADTAATTGTITITNATIGKDYAAYKVFDATVDGNGNIAYTYAGELPENNGYFTQDSAGNVTATAAATDANGKLTSGAIAFLSTLLELDDADKTNDATPVASTTATSDTVVFSDLPFGYYYITSSLGTAVTVDSTNPTASVIDKNQTTSFDKWIIAGYDKNGDPILVKGNNVNVGDTVPYLIEINATNYNGEKYITNYYVYDKMNEALTFNNDVEVTVNGTKVTNFTMVQGTAAAPYNFEINIPWVDQNGAFLYNKTNSKIVVTYSATVNEKIYTAGSMKNEAEYNFKDQDTPPTKPYDDIISPDPVKPKKTTDSYSTKIKVCKVDEKGNALTGAKFSFSGFSSKVVIVNEEIFVPYVAAADGETQPTAYYMLKNGKYTEDAPVKVEYFRVATAEERAQGGYVLNGDEYVAATEEQRNDSTITIYVKVLPNTDDYDAENIDNKFMKVTVVSKETADPELIDVEGWVGSDGIIEFKGIGEGLYTVTELVAPNGYNLLTAPVYVKVAFTYDEEKEVGAFKAYYADAQGNILKDEAGNDKEISLTNGIIQFNVVNTPGSELPETGGIGTKLFYVFGSILLVGAAVLLITKKRVSVEG